MSVSNTPIAVEGLCKHYGGKGDRRGSSETGDHLVLTRVDLEVLAGEVFALLGPNGAGKTTTVEILEGYREATAGLVRVLGFDPAVHPRELRERTGVVLQECGFPSHLRVGELIDGWRAYYPAPRPRDELLDIVELRDERDSLVRRLSGGQRRRLDFALALAGDPDLIFLDEPTTGFDPEARRRCWSAIENLRALGKTVLLTTHYLDEAERLADRVAILNNGTIRAVGTPSQLAHLAMAPNRITYTGLDGQRTEIRTDDTSGRLRELLAAGDVVDLAVAPPTLEDTYLELVAQ
jgi:ABC-2 type transport system ATP-binding protein